MSTPDENGWLPIETAPMDGTAVLGSVYVSKQCVMRWIKGHWTLYYTERDGWMRWLRGPEKWLALSETPTHWQPLPAPPVERKSTVTP